MGIAFHKNISFRKRGNPTKEAYILKYVQLGKTDLNVSRICFGCWQLSPRYWGKVSEDDWRNAFRSALDLGINFIDTADAYGDGYAEEMLGEAIAKVGCRDRVILATKFLWNFEQAERVADTSYDYILRECEASLKRLKTDYIDLYQLHGWDAITRPDEVSAAISKLKQDGKIRWFGVSNLNTDQMRMYSEYVDIECLQPMYNMVARDCESQLFPLCLEKRIGVITWSSLYSGLLTGKYKRDQHFEDFRAKEPLFQPNALGHILDGLDEIRPIAESHGLTIPQLAIRWILTHPAVTSAIVGIKKPEHIESIVAAAEDILPRRDWYHMANIMASAKKKALAHADENEAVSESDGSKVLVRRKSSNKPKN